MDLLSDVVLGLLPTVGVTLLFAIAILAIIRADAGERADRARIEAEEDAAAAAAQAERGPVDPAPGAPQGGVDGGGAGKV